MCKRRCTKLSERSVKLTATEKARANAQSGLDVESEHHLLLSSSLTVRPLLFGVQVEFFMWLAVKYRACMHRTSTHRSYVCAFPQHNGQYWGWFTASSSFRVTTSDQGSWRRVDTDSVLATYRNYFCSQYIFLFFFINVLYLAGHCARVLFLCHTPVYG